MIYLGFKVKNKTCELNVGWHLQLSIVPEFKFGHLHQMRFTNRKKMKKSSYVHQIIFLRSVPRVYPIPPSCQSGGVHPPTGQSTLGCQSIIQIWRAYIQKDTSSFKSKQYSCLFSCLSSSSII